MSHKDELKRLFTEARRTAKLAADIKVEFAALREAATQKGFDWSQIKALATADVADEEKGDGKRVQKIVEKADFAAAYADMLGLRIDERKTQIRSSSNSAAARSTTRTAASPTDTQQSSISPGDRLDGDGSAVEPAAHGAPVAAGSPIPDRSADDGLTIPAGLRRDKHNRVPQEVV